MYGTGQLDPYLFVSGIAAGFVIAFPVGPVGVLCIRKALAHGRGAAFVAGLGAAVADTFYGAVAALGISVVLDFIIGHQDTLCIVGGIVLILIGLQTVRAHPDLGTEPTNGAGLIKDFVSTFLITLTNPATILAFLSVFATIGAFHAKRSVYESWVLVLGVFLGSALWWLVLSGAVSAVRSRFTQKWLTWTNRVSGILLILSGLGVLVSMLFP